MGTDPGELIIVSPYVKEYAAASVEPLQRLSTRNPRREVNKINTTHPGSFKYNQLVSMT